MYRIISSHLYYIVWNYNNDFECRKWMFNYKSYYLFFTWFPFKDVLLCPNFVLPIINGGGVIFWFHQIWKRVWKIHCCLFVESVRPFVVSFPGKLMGGFLFIKLAFDKWKKSEEAWNRKLLFGQNLASQVVFDRNLPNRNIHL